jgi:hypothetical protein
MVQMGAKPHIVDDHNRTPCDVLKLRRVAIGHDVLVDACVDWLEPRQDTELR